ncbi:MAG: hypothetical protein E7442_09150 [Ruminococcaceae bacterium]|nr:hypothetical protein [Oscillospiraceae bacterium]
MERESFERVWQRVQGAERPLERQLREEAESAAFYGWLRRSCPSCGGAAAAMERECRASLEKLRFEYFLVWGEAWVQPEIALPGGGVLTNLRRQYQREHSRAQSSVGELRRSREKRAATLRWLLQRGVQ